MSAPTPSIFAKRRAPGIESADYLAVDYRTTEKIVTEEAQPTSRVLDELGNPELPIVAYREQIVSSIISSQATVIAAETGAGKSTQVPQFLAEAGYEVILTQPRRVATRSIAERIKEEVIGKKGKEFAYLVGYEMRGEKDRSDANLIVVATDGLQQVRELAGRGVGKKQVLVLDEVHEWNENMEVLVAWAKRRMDEDPDFKAVVMSATMETGPIAKFLSGGGKREVPVIDIPGREFAVEKTQVKASNLDEIMRTSADKAAEFAMQGKSSLVFMPGKAEIARVIEILSLKNMQNVTVLPLDGQLDSVEQRKVFAKYSGSVIIVSTNVAQTSVTIEGIDVVVDSGLERRSEVKNNVEGLFMRPISRADCLQRAGRAGRTHDGEYVLVSDIGLDEREPYGTPEILRTRLDGTVLRLAKNGLDAAGLEFYHQPKHEEIVNAKERLYKLGALTDSGEITHIGRAMERMPLESHYARMMIEARKYSPEVQTQLAALLGVQEADGILQFETKNKSCEERWHSLLADGFDDSDVIKQLEVFIAAQRMSNGERRGHDIFTKAFSKANEVFRQLRRVEKLDDMELTLPTLEERQQLVKCIISGMVDNLYIRASLYSGHSDARGNQRELGNRRLIRIGDMIVGEPYDLQIQTRRGSQTLRLIQNVTNVPSADILREVAPQLFSEKHHNFSVGENGLVVEYRRAFFNGADTGKLKSYQSEPSEERRDWIVDELYKWATYPMVKKLRNVVGQVHQLQERTEHALPSFTDRDAKELLRRVLPITASSLEEADSFVPDITLTDIVPSELSSKIMADSPDRIGDYALTYSNGQVVATVGMSHEIWANLPDEVLSLPDGRDIMARPDYWSAPIALSQLRQMGIERLALAEKQRVAEELAQRERQVAENMRKAEEKQARDARFIEDTALAIAESGETGLADWEIELLGADLVEAARVRAREIVAQKEAESRRELERQRAAVELETARNQLENKNQDLYDRLSFDDVSDMPESLTDRIYKAKLQLDDYRRLSTRSLDEVANVQARLDKTARDIDKLNSDIEDWRRTQAKAEVTPDMLAALRERYGR